MKQPMDEMSFTSLLCKKPVLNLVTVHLQYSTQKQQKLSKMLNTLNSIQLPLNNKNLQNKKP